MPGAQPQIDNLLADVDALADSAVSEILGTSDEHIPLDDPNEDVISAPAASTPRATASTLSEAASSSGNEDITRILSLQVPIIVLLAKRTIPLSEILDLTTGSIIEFDKPADSDLDLMINNKGIGRGHAVKVGENFGLRITRIGSVRSRIQAMGSS